MPPLTITQVLKLLYQALKEWNPSLKADVSIALDAWNVLEILASGPQGFRLVVHWAGDTNISDLDELTLSDNDLQVILSYNLGLLARRDLALITGTTARPPLYDLVDELRSYLLSLRYPEIQTGSYLVYAGSEPVVTPDGVPLAAHRLRFKLKTDVTVDPILKSVNL